MNENMLGIHDAKQRKQYSGKNQLANKRPTSPENTPLGILDTGTGRTETTTQDTPHGKHDRSDSKHESHCLSWTSDTPQASAEKQSDDHRDYHNPHKNEMQESRRPQEASEVNLEMNKIRAMIDKSHWPMISA